MPHFEKDPDEIGVLWVKTSPKGDYMTGVINGVNVVVFKVKSASDRAPDWQVLKAKPRTPKPDPVVDDVSF